MDEIITLNGRKYRLVEENNDWIIPKGWVRYGNIVLQEKASKEVFTWKEANEQMTTCLLRKKNGESKTFIAKLLSKKQLEKLPEDAKKADMAYWTATQNSSGNYYYIMDTNGATGYSNCYDSDQYGVRLGFELTD